MGFVGLCLLAGVISWHLLNPPKTQEMLREWEAENGVEIIKAVRLNYPWSMAKWGVFSQSQRFIRVLVRDIKTEVRTEMVLCLGGLLLGLAVKRVRICEIRRLKAEGAALSRGGAIQKS